MMARGRGGFTLIELIAVIAVLSVTSIVGALALGSALAPQPSAGKWEVRILEARRRAIATGAAVVLSPDTDSLGAEVLFMPDGRAIGGKFDPLTGSWVGR